MPSDRKPPNVSELSTLDSSDTQQSSEYQVGRGRPPLHTRFKSGGNGGPGRPKGSKNRATLFREALDTPRPVTIDGKRRRMTSQELAYRQLARKAASGDLKALSLAEQIRNSLCGPDEGEQRTVAPLTDAEMAILQRMSSNGAE